MVPSKEIIAELNRLGLNSIYDLVQSNFPISVIIDGQREVVLVHPQLSMDGSELKIHFFDKVDTCNMFVDGVVFKSHLGRWICKEVPGSKYPGDPPSAEVSIKRPPERIR